ncbi:MAG: hypothetical protein M3494_14815 [Actinomycetota bacterium]|jgi:hypothetical protein|nr:hypothetical protein [Rubrobacter sp.]MDQ3509260.1 hypothetical protein [Actinomycetota bacterium]
MDFIARNRGLIVFGVVWGLVLAALPAVFAFDDPFTLSPFLVSAFVCSALAGVVGATLAGRWVSGRSGMLASLFAGILHGVVFSVFASLTIWICLAVNISGFSTATPGNIFNLVSNPGIFAMSGVAAWAIFVYSLAAGMVLSLISGSFILRAGGGGVAGYNLRSGKGSI